MSAELTEADLPVHPDPHAWTWTDAEKRAILRWGEALLATRATPAPGAPGQEAAAVQAVEAWQDIATAPASSETVLVVTQLGTVRTETGHYVRNMASSAAEFGEQCFFKYWMPAPKPPAALPPSGAGEKTS